MMDLELTVKTLIISAIVIYMLSFVLALISLLGYIKDNKIFPQLYKAAVIIFSFGWCVNLSVFIINWVIAQNPPFGNMYHVMSFLPLSLLPLFFYVKYIQKSGWLLPFFAMSAFLPLIGTCYMKHEIVWNRMPALQSPWFVPHVSAYILSYSLAAVAFFLIFPAFIIVIFLYLVNNFYNRNLFSSKINKYRPFLNLLGKVEKAFTEAAYKVMLIAFPFMTFGLLSGALWAEEAWGAYWNWDIKEAWSLITWSLYLIYFHCRFSKGIRKWQYLAHILAFAALIVTFILVNKISAIQSLHSYAN